MKRTLTLLFFLITIIAFSQQHERTAIPAGQWNTAPLTDADAAILNTIEELKIPADYKSRSLPDSIDNSLYKWFRRPIFTQESYPNCMQSTSIAYNFTYEINRLRDQPGDDPDHQYTTHFAWNFFNGGNGWWGVNYLFTMDVLKYHGTPSVTDYGGFYEGGGQRWMSGYDEWYNAMNNRISGIKKIYVGDEEGIITLKHWLNDHMDGSPAGGLASFIACSPYDMAILPPESPQTGKHVILGWCPEALHGMTIIGYNDSIRYDYNEDGKFTNDIDLNNDGVLDVSDWEIGAMKFCNSYGEGWADSGYCYMMYKTLADRFGEGGIWTNTVHVLEAKAEHDTRMTYKVTLEHDYREAVRVQAGISSDLTSNKPEHIHSYTIFNYQGGWHYMQGNDTTEANKTIEFGLDVSPLLSHVEAGMPYKFFLIVDEKDPDNKGYGQIKNFSLIDYQDGVAETVCEEQNVVLNDNGRTMMSVIYEPAPNDLTIVTESIPVYEASQPMSIQLEATGGQQPYQWQLDRNYVMNSTEAAFPEVDEVQIINNSWTDSLAMQVLDFEFPFYGNYYGTLVVSSGGYIFIDENMYFWSYLVDNDYFLKNSRVIAPLLSQDLFVHQGTDDGVWYEGDETKATFRWKTATFDKDWLDINFAVSLYPDGRIEFFYDEMTLDEPIRWTAGISDGDFFHHSLPDLPDPPGIPSGTKIEFFPKAQPEEITVSKDGLLEIMESQESTLAELKFALTDNTLLSATKTCLFTDALEFSISMNGEDDLSIQNGQIAYLDLNVVNRGTAGIQNIDFSLSAEYHELEILDNQYLLEQIAPGESISIASAFSCSCDKDIADNAQMMLHLNAVAASLSYHRECILSSSAPDMELSGFEVRNEINLLEPGETEDLKLRLVNKGSRVSINTVAVLSSSHEGITINNSQPVNVGTINPWEDKEVLFSLSADYSISFGSEVDFTLLITDEIGVNTEMNFSMRVGRTPAYIIDLDLSTGSGVHIYEHLQDMGVESNYSPKFPNSISNYQSVFLCVGKMFTSHTLSWQQGQMLLDYLDDGGNLYMEGRMVWEQDPHLPILDRFGFTTVTSAGGYEILRGVDSTFTEGLAYENTAQNSLCLYYLEPTPPAFSIFTGVEYPNCAAVAYDAGGYKTIGTMFEMGGLISSDTCQMETLMQNILDFFEVKQSLLGVEEMPEMPDGTALQNYPNPFSHETRIPVKLEKKSLVDAAVYDLQGRRVYDLSPSSTLEAGSYNFTWDGRSNSGHALPDGIYLYRILVEGIPYTGKMVLIR